jgi:serine protease Do
VNNIQRRGFLLMALLGVTAGSNAGLVEVIAKVRGSIFPVGSYNALENPRFRFRGTGFVVGNGNQLITNAHVLPESDGDGQAGLVLQLPARPGVVEMRSATVVAVDKTHDLVLLHFEGSPLPALGFAEPSRIQEGMSVALIGFPIGGVLGFSPVTHRGIISSITAVALPTPTSQQLNEKNVRRLREGSFNVYQLDATAYPGNSGGPVLDVETGQVVGVVNMVLVKGTKESALSQPTGISYAIPARFADELMKQR